MQPKRAINSASNLLRRKLCVGSANAETGLPNEDSPFAAEGTLLHWHDANEAASREKLSPKQREILELNKASRDKFLAHHLEALGIAEEPVILTEREFFLCDENLIPIEPEFPCHPDLVLYYKAAKIGFIFDSKFGRVEVPSAEMNMQLRAYAVVLADEFECDKIYVAITQPWAAAPADFHAAQYCAADMPHFKREILDIIKATQFPDAPRVASVSACAYCKARASCREAQNIIGELAVRAVNGLSIEDLEARWPDARRARDVIDQMETRLKKIAKELPDALKTLKLGSSGEVRSISDTLAAFGQLQDAGLSQEEVFSCCSISIASLEELMAKRGSGMKVIEAERTIERALGDLVQRTQKAEKLVKK